MISYKKLLYFDIETAGEFKNWEDFSNTNKDGASAFKIKYNRAQKNNNNHWDGTIDDAYLNNSPLLAEYGKIICISYGVFINGKFSISSKSINDFPDEKGLVNFISKLFTNIEPKGLFLSGHNIRGFDIPFIFKKMLKYSIKIPNNISIIDKKPWDIKIYDTGDITKGTGFVSSSLADVTYLLGLKSPKDDIFGGEVHGIYWNDNDVDRIVVYCEKDVVAIKDICVRLNECFGETI